MRSHGVFMFLGFHTTWGYVFKPTFPFTFIPWLVLQRRERRAKCAHFIPITRMVLCSSSGWEQQQLERQMKCTINNSNTFRFFTPDLNFTSPVSTTDRLVQMKHHNWHKSAPHCKPKLAHLQHCNRYHQYRFIATNYSKSTSPSKSLRKRGHQAKRYNIDFFVTSATQHGRKRATFAFSQPLTAAETRKPDDGVIRAFWKLGQPSQRQATNVKLLSNDAMVSFGMCTAMLTATALGLLCSCVSFCMPDRRTAGRLFHLAVLRRYVCLW